jgi:hypothetical protein
MNKIMLASLIILAVLSAGCPRNYYEVTLTPRGGVFERTLTFYCMDDKQPSADAPHRDCFDPDELASIAAIYSKTGMTNNGDRHTVRDKFAGTMPQDIGGSGWHRTLSTSLGDAGFYVERFRGNDDLAGMINRRFQAADQLTDLVIGWSKRQFQSEPGFKRLHRFLDQEFRQDLKNSGVYFGMGDAFTHDSSIEESLVHFMQYLIERGYVKPEEAPRLMLGLDVDDATLCRMIRRLIVEKLAIGGKQPMPRSLMFLDDPKAALDSWRNYLAGTDSYRARLRKWKNETGPDSKEQKPDPVIVATDLTDILLETATEIDSGSRNLTVKLLLPSEPVRTNGKWDKEHKQVVWKSNLAQKDKIFRMPVLCHADWVAPKEDFQKAHFGRVLLTGEKLLNYCIWRTSLEEKKAVEWEQFMANLKPAEDTIGKLKNFRFAGEPEKIDSKGPRRSSDIGKELIQKALQSNQ